MQADARLPLCRRHVCHIWMVVCRDFDPQRLVHGEWRMMAPGMFAGEFGIWRDRLLDNIATVQQGTGHEQGPWHIELHIGVGVDRHVGHEPEPTDRAAFMGRKWWIPGLHTRKKALGWHNPCTPDHRAVITQPEHHMPQGPGELMEHRRSLAQAVGHVAKPFTEIELLASPEIIADMAIGEHALPVTAFRRDGDGAQGRKLISRQAAQETPEPELPHLGARLIRFFVVPFPPDERIGGTFGHGEILVPGPVLKERHDSRNIEDLGGTDGRVARCILRAVDVLHGVAPYTVIQQHGASPLTTKNKKGRMHRIANDHSQTHTDSYDS